MLKGTLSVTSVSLESAVDICGLIFNDVAVEIREHCAVMARSLDALQTLMSQLPQREFAISHTNSLESALQKLEELAQCLTRPESWN